MFVLARRKCQVCEWEAEAVEKVDANPDCPWCRAPTTPISATLLEATPPRSAGNKNANAAALGRLGGRKGGHARAAALSPKRRREIAVRAARARWQKKR